MFDELLMQILAALVLCGPSILVGLAAVLIRISVKQEKAWAKIVLALGLLCLTWILLGSVATIGEQAVMLLEICLALPIGIAFVVGIMLVRQRSAWSKMIGLIVGVVFPIGALAALPLGYSLSNEVADKRSGEIVAAALEQYHTDTGVYPATLRRLVPKYLDEIPEARAGQWMQETEWMYNTDRKAQFSLGFWYYNDETHVCQYHSGEAEWSCGIEDYPLFSLVNEIVPLP